MRVMFWNWWKEKEFYLIPTVILSLESKSIEIRIFFIEIEVLFD